ncbi:hypothetical protein IQ07DRAFT_160128 [Pyrenochaeta sp. DS3sAY3a]|nr:hypothetical protein IQ07DRAFT_160128 [Pyrenochaeta sp. DS3sAY3a]
MVNTDEPVSARDHENLMAVLQRTKAQKIALSSAQKIALSSTIDPSLPAQIKALQFEMKMVKDQNTILKSKVEKLEEPRDATNAAGAASLQALGDAFDKLKRSLPKDYITEEQVKDIFKKEFADETQKLLDTSQKQLESSKEDLQKQHSSFKNDIEKQLNSWSEHMQKQLNISTEGVQNQLSSSTQDMQNQLKISNEYLQNNLDSAREEMQKQLSNYEDKVQRQLNTSEGKFQELLHPVKEDLRKQIISAVSSEKRLQDKLDSSEKKIQSQLDSSERKLAKEIAQLHSSQLKLTKRIMMLDGTTPLPESFQKSINKLKELSEQVATMNENIVTLDTSDQEITHQLRHLEENLLTETSSLFNERFNPLKASIERLNQEFDQVKNSASNSTTDQNPDAPNLDCLSTRFEQAEASITDFQNSLREQFNEIERHKKRFDSLTNSFRGLQEQCTNITTEHITQQMVHWFNQMYPSNGNMLLQLSSVQSEVTRLKAIFQPIADRLPRLLQFEEAASPALGSVRQIETMVINLDRDIRNLQTDFISLRDNPQENSTSALATTQSNALKSQVTQVEAELKRLIDEEMRARDLALSAMKTTLSDEHDRRVNAEQKIRVEQSTIRNDLESRFADLNLRYSKTVTRIEDVEKQQDEAATSARLELSKNKSDIESLFNNYGQIVARVDTVEKKQGEAAARAATQKKNDSERMDGFKKQMNLVEEYVQKLTTNHKTLVEKIIRDRNEVNQRTEKMKASLEAVQSPIDRVSDQVKKLRDDIDKNDLNSQILHIQADVQEKLEHLNQTKANAPTGDKAIPQPKLSFVVDLHNLAPPPQGASGSANDKGKGKQRT